jgi:hypothetical protein
MKHKVSLRVLEIDMSYSPLRDLSHWPQIGLTITPQAFRAISSTLLAESARPEVPAREYLVWLPQIAVDHLRDLREPGETFSDVILRLTQTRDAASRSPTAVDFWWLPPGSSEEPSIPGPVGRAFRCVRHATC